MLWMEVRVYCWWWFWLGLSVFVFVSGFFRIRIRFLTRSTVRSLKENNFFKIRFQIQKITFCGRDERWIGVIGLAKTVTSTFWSWNIKLVTIFGCILVCWSVITCLLVGILHGGCIEYPPVYGFVYEWILWRSESG